MQLREVIQQVQEIGQEHGFTIIIVGGAMVRLIGSKTEIKHIDEKNRIITLVHSENPGLKRYEDSKTTVDIDCIVFSNASDPFLEEIKESYNNLLRALSIFRKSIEMHPAISLEPVLYHPYFPRPNELTQFVSSIESYHDNDFFFRLGTIKQDIDKESLGFWTYTFSDSDEKIISFSPLALQKRYGVRGFAIKPKDKEKIWGKASHFAKFVWDFTKKSKIDYQKVFLEWDEFAKNITQSKQPSMILKKKLWNMYWNTIGTYLAHGTGLVGKILLPLGNTFFAGK